MWKHTENFSLPILVGAAMDGLLAIGDWRLAFLHFSIFLPIGVAVCYALDWQAARRRNAFD